MRGARSVCLAALTIGWASFFGSARAVAGAGAETPAAPATAPTTAPATRPTRVLLIRAVHAETGDPIGGVRIGMTVIGGQSEVITLDDRGEYRASIPADTRGVRLFYSKENFVGRMVALGAADELAPNPAPVPERVTLRLTPGLAIGGLVRDDKGQPVEKVSVGLTFEVSSPDAPGGVGMAYGGAETDAQGRWSFGGAPANPNRVEIFARHPDFVMRSFSHRVDPGQWPALRDKTLVTTLQRGVSVGGTVVDAGGRPVANAEVTPDQFGLITCVHSDAEGRFLLRGVAPGRTQLAARADGLAPQVREVDVAAGAKPVEFRLEKGGLLAGRVTGAGGKPIAGVYVQVKEWGGSKALPLGLGATDADGRFKSNSVPPGPLTLTINHRDYPAPADVHAAAGDKDVQLVLHEPPIVRGTVVDADTGKAIDAFKVRGEVELGGGARGVYPRNGAGGRYEVKFTNEGSSYLVRIEAEGYLPVASPKLTPAPDGGPMEFDARLSKGERLTRTLLRPDGKPAAGAEVVLCERVSPTLHDGVLDGTTRSSNTVLTTDAAGRYAMPPRTSVVTLLAVHESGWAQFQFDPATPAKPVSLRAWATVEGRAMRGGKPAAGQAVTLRPQVDYNRPAADRHDLRQLFMYTAAADAQGRFTIRRAVDGEATVALQHTDHGAGGREGYPTSHGIAVTLKPGESIKGLQLGGTGRPVVGRVALPEELKARGGGAVVVVETGQLSLLRPAFIQPEKWDDLGADERQRLRREFEQTDAYRQYAARVQQIAAMVAPDGAFRAEDVPAGEYTLWFGVRTNRPDEQSMFHLDAAAQVDVDVPEMPGGRSDAPLDVGEVRLKVVHNPDVGQAAPLFDVTRLDPAAAPATNPAGAADAAAAAKAGRIRLADYRGKYVLLTFWATWCGPCVAEIKTLERIQQAHGNDPRFVMISLSTDDRTEAPLRFLRARKLPWLQGHAGHGSGSSVRTDFGIQGIPSVWLIAPDGKIVAKTLQEHELEAVVDEALAGKR